MTHSTINDNAHLHLSQAKTGKSHEYFDETHSLHKVWLS